jgi:nitrite reductase/ring-hydroxylating ferredoxin subunit
MAQRFKVGATKDFLEGEGRVVRVEGKKVAVFRVGGRLLAVQDTCPHMASSFVEGGRLHGKRVTCGWHGWSFDLESGQGDRSKDLRTYAVEVKGDDVFLSPPVEPAKEAVQEEEWPVWDDGFIKGDGPKDG